MFKNLLFYNSRSSRQGRTEKGMFGGGGGGYYTIDIEF